MAYVSDHAILRYLERVRGIDIEAVRAELTSPTIDVACREGCDTILRHDCVLILHGDVVQTVLTKQMGRRRA